MSPLVPAADREHLSRVRASLAQDGLDLAMIGHDRQRLLAYAAAIATGLAEKGGWQVEKYYPARLETLLANLMARFDGALHNLFTQGSRRSIRPSDYWVLFITDGQRLTSAELRQRVRLIQGAGHQLCVFALFHSDALTCESQISALGHQVARRYLDKVPDDLPSHTMQGATPNQPRHALRQRTVSISHQRVSTRVGVALTVSLMLALMLGPILWPSVIEIARRVERTPSLAPAVNSSLAGVPVFLPSEHKVSSMEGNKTGEAAEVLEKTIESGDVLDSAETAGEAVNKQNATLIDHGASTR